MSAAAASPDGRPSAKTPASMTATPTATGRAAAAENVVVAVPAPVAAWTAAAGVAPSVLNALSRPPLTVLRSSDLTRSTLFRISDFTADADSVPFLASTSATVPVTCGVAIDVPLYDA